MKRRIVAILLAAGMIMGSLSGCGQSAQTQESKTEKTETASTKAGSTEAGSTEEAAQDGPITTEPITISILTQRHAEALSNSADELWFFKYLEWWINEQGYNVTIKVEQTQEADQQIPLLLGTDSLPDLIWGINLSETNAVAFGAGQGVILDWAPYINEENMPNLYALLQEEPGALVASTCTDGGVYALPRFGDRIEGAAAGNMPIAERIYINQNWLDECNLDVPETMDEFIDMLRTFKSEIKLEGDKEVIPMISTSQMFEKYLWTALGYYGTTPATYGNGWMIKDEQLVYPAASEDYRTYIEIMKTCYDEGLISQDHFTMDGTTARGLMADGVAGVIGDWTLGSSQPESFGDWVSALPAAAGDNDQVVASLGSSYSLNSLWASANTEYPEVIAKLIDYLYSAEGEMYYMYGPMKGQDPLGILDGWYFVDKDGIQAMTCDLVEDGTYANFDSYCKTLVYSNMYIGNAMNLENNAKELAGVEYTAETRQYADAITGDMITINSREWDKNSADGWWRITTMTAWESAATLVSLPTAFLSEEDSLRASELALLLNEYITAESAKFITGARPVSEIDDYYKELDKLGLQEYTEIYTTAYKTFMEETF